MKQLIVFLWCVFFQQTAIATESLPEELIRNASNQVLSRIQSDPEKYQQDPAKLYALVDQIVLPHFDFGTMTDLALGRYKTKISTEQRRLITNEFRILLVRTYGKALLEYNDQKIIYLPIEGSLESGDVTVRTEIEQKGGFPIPLNYSLKQTGHGWKVYDISVDDISLVTNYRSSFSRQIRKNGIDGLIKTLRERNQDL
ncbi:putative phospholipid-binding protein MlaC [bacterium MnTg03]|nr:putative phospholipid-binding protein MlaC [bacterium MnTg03]